MKRIPIAAATVAGCLVLAACGRHLSTAVRPNAPPEVRLTASVLPSAEGAADRYRLRWAASDPDGRIAHFRVAVDPRSVDRVDDAWARTSEEETIVVAPAVRPDGRREPRIFAVRAVDDRGAMSGARSLAFFADNLPPVVAITHPRPNSLVTLLLPPALRIAWAGSDPDGRFTDRPIKYKYILLSRSSEFPMDLAIQDPDSLRRYYAPHFAGWDSTGADTTEVRYRNLVIGETYLFVVTGFDEAGDYDPVFSLNKNMLRFRVAHPKFLGPAITLFGEGFEFAYHGHVSDPERAPRVEVPAGQPVRLGWFAVPAVGAEVVGYRWVLDPVDLYDDRTREDPDDLSRWSPLDGTTSLTLGPFAAGPKGTPRLLYVEAHDSFGMRGLAVLNLFVLEPRFSQELLIVDDTRLQPDRVDATGCALPPVGPWPTAAELDTFLYARGGVPWRCYPPGTVSPPGIFAGYEYDTIGTRGIPSGVVSLATLSRYRHVVWYVDVLSATNVGGPGDPSQPITALRLMSSPGQVNALAAYVSAGGKVWLAGGGGAYASQITWNDPSNDVPTTVFSSASTRRELVPGRFMYDLAAWRSEIRVARLPAQITRFTGRFQGGPQYGGAPAAMQPKTAATDPLPPFRTAGQFYQSAVDLEFLQRPNEIVEEPGANPNPPGQSTLDTLFRAAGAGLPLPAENPHNVVMTLYRRPGGVPFVFTGFNFWSFRRTQCVDLVDFVLQDLWGLSRAPFRADPVPRGGAAARAGVAGERAAPGGR